MFLSSLCFWRLPCIPSPVSLFKVCVQLIERIDEFLSGYETMAVFIDTGVFLALRNADDELHIRSKEPKSINHFLAMYPKRHHPNKMKNKNRFQTLPYVNTCFQNHKLGKLVMFLYYLPANLLYLFGGNL